MITIATKIVFLIKKKNMGNCHQGLSGLRYRLSVCEQLRETAMKIAPSTPAIRFGQGAFDRVDTQLLSQANRIMRQVEDQSHGAMVFRVGDWASYAPYEQGGFSATFYNPAGQQGKKAQVSVQPDGSLHQDDDRNSFFGFIDLLPQQAHNLVTRLMREVIAKPEKILPQDIHGF